MPMRLTKMEFPPPPLEQCGGRGCTLLKGILIWLIVVVIKKKVIFLKICENDICFSNVWWRRICDEWAVMLTRGFTELMTRWVFLVSELWKREGLLLANIEWKASKCVWYSSLISEEGKCAGKENPILLLIGWEF